MALTDHQEELIQVLKAFGVGREDIIALMLLMETDEMSAKMIDWMVETRDRDKSFSDLMGMALALNKKFSKK